MKQIWIALLFILVSCASHHQPDRYPASLEQVEETFAPETYMLNK